MLRRAYGEGPGLSEWLPLGAAFGALDEFIAGWVEDIEKRMSGLSNVYPLQIHWLGHLSVTQVISPDKAIYLL